MSEPPHDADGLPGAEALIAGVVHEVRNVLFACSVNLEVLEATPVDPDEQREAIEALREEYERLNALTGDLAELGRAEPESLESQALIPLVGEAARAVAETTGVPIELAAGNASGRVRMERERLRLALERLLRAACRRAPKGRPLQMEVGEFLRDDRPWLRCRVCDENPGHGPEALLETFEPFSRYAGRSDRLGLAIVRRIVAQHGGQVVATSAPGRGTVLGVELPCG